MKLKKLLLAFLCFSILSPLASAMEGKKPFSAIAAQIQKIAQNSNQQIPAFGNSLLKKAPQDYFTIDCSDRKLILPLTTENKKKLESLKQNSKTITDMIQDGCTIDKEIDVPGIKSTELDVLLTLILKIDDQKFEGSLSPDEALSYLTKLQNEDELEEKLKSFSLQEIASLLKNADYLNVHGLIEKTGRLIAQRMEEKVNALNALSGLEKAIGSYQALDGIHVVDEKVVEKINFPHLEKLIISHTLRTLKGCGRINGVAISANGTRGLVAVDEEVLVWDLARRKQLARLKGHSHGVNSVAINADGKIGITGSRDGTTRIWDLDKNSEQAVLMVSGGLEEIAVSADGKKAIFKDKWGGSVRVWDLEQKIELANFGGPTGGSDAVAISADGKIGMASAENKVRVFDLKLLKELAVLDGHTKWVDSVAISDDGKKGLSGGHDGTMRVWDLNTCEEIEKINIQAPHGLVSMSSEGRRCMSGPGECLWDLHKLKKIAQINAPSGYNERAAISADGKKALTTRHCRKEPNDLHQTLNMHDFRLIFELEKLPLDQGMLVSYILRNSQKEKPFDLKMFPKLESIYKSLPEDLKKTINIHSTVLVNNKDWKKCAYLLIGLGSAMGANKLWNYFKNK